MMPANPDPLPEHLAGCLTGISSKRRSVALIS